MSQKKKVLIAEDSSVIQNLTRKILQLQNFEIFSVKNGKDVLSFLEKQPVDIILMDLAMPVMDGVECTRAIRELDDPGISQVPILAVTGNAQNFTMEEFAKIGITDYIPKPLNFDQLVTMVKKYTR